MARNPLSPYRSGGLQGGLIDPFQSLHREMNRLFDDVFRTGSAQEAGQGGGVALSPNMDVSETENEVRICAELPGVKEEDVDLTLNDDVLTIRGEKKFERKDDRENYHFLERSYGSFQRSLRLPYPVNPDEVRADFENGVLTVSIPKSQQQQRSRRIQVQKGSGAQSGGGQGAMSSGQQGRVGQQPSLQQAASRGSQGGSQQGGPQQGGSSETGKQSGQGRDETMSGRT
jgi:HSP20 family protein